MVIGHNAKTKEELNSMIREGRWNEFIRQVPVKKGDFIQIDPGTVHAIKGGIQILETQQSSDVTYRVYDYDRLSNGKPRELHVDKSIDVINSSRQIRRRQYPLCREDRGYGYTNETVDCLRLLQSMEN